MRFIAVLITALFGIVGIKLCLTGNRLYDESQVFPQAERVDYQRFARERPLEGWYQVTGSVVDLTEAAYKSAQVNTSPEYRATANDVALIHEARDVYVPVRDETMSGGPGAADLILLSRDPDLVNTVKQMAGGPDTSTHVTTPRVIKGMVRAPSELPDRVRRALGNSINTQSIIIEEYAAPSGTRALATMGAGAALILSVALLWLFIWRRDRMSTAVEIPDEYMPDALILDDDAE